MEVACKYMSTAMKPETTKQLLKTIKSKKSNTKLAQKQKLTTN